MTSKRAPCRRAPPGPMGRRDGHFPFQDGELLVQVDADLPEVAVEAEGVAGGDGRRPPVPRPLTRTMPSRALKAFMAGNMSSISRTSKRRPARLTASTMPKLAPNGRNSRPASRTVTAKRPGEPGRGGRASGSAPDDDGALHPRPALAPELGPAGIMSVGQSLGESELTAAREPRQDPPVEGRNEPADLGRVVRREAAGPDDDRAVRAALEVDADRPVKDARRGHGLGKGPHAQRPPELLAEAFGRSRKASRRRPRTCPAARTFEAFSREKDAKRRRRASYDVPSRSGAAIPKASAVRAQSLPRYLFLRDEGRKTLAALSLRLMLHLSTGPVRTMVPFRRNQMWTTAPMSPSMIPLARRTR